MIKRFVNINFSKNQQQLVNIITSILNLCVSAIISMVFSPYIVKNIGVEANGFVTIGNDFILYVTLFRTALNSMGSRFLMMAYYKGDNKKFEIYYSSLFYADLILALVLGAVGGFCVWKLEYILQIPKELVTDVKLLFGALFLNFVIATIITVWNTAPYIKNRLYLDSITLSLNSIIRCVTMAALFVCLIPKVYYVGVATLVAGLICYTLRFLYKKILFPDLKAKKSNFSWKAVWELLSSGVWNAISSLGTILISGLDVLIANLFISSYAMGVLSVAKTVPSFISTLISTMAGVFVPTLIIAYSKKMTESIVKEVIKISKIISVVATLPLGFLIVYGYEFYSLWQPSLDAGLIYILSLITIFGRVFFTGVEPLFQIFTVVNKVKQNSIVTIINGLVSILVTYILVKTTNLGVYAIAGVSVACCFVKNIIFVIPYSAKYLGLKKTTFFNTVGYSISCCAVLCLWGAFEKLFIKGNTWSSIILSAVVFAIIGLLITTIVILNKDERNYLLAFVKKKVKK